MPCEQCGAALFITDSQAGIRGGRFTETYECVACGANGMIRGRAETPTPEWSHRGPAFEA